MKNRNVQRAANGILVAAIVWSLCDIGAAFAQVGIGADPAVRRHWNRRYRVGYVRERCDRIVQSNLFGFVSNHGFACHRRARRNSDGIHRTRNGRHQSIAGSYAEPVDRRANRYCAMSDYGNADDGRITDVLRRLLTPRSKDLHPCVQESPLLPSLSS